MNKHRKEKLLRGIAWLTRRFHPPGTERLLRLIYHPDRRESDHFEYVMEYDSGLFINIDTSDFLEWLIFFFGYHEPGLTRQIKRLIKPGFVAFDIGANSGSHTLIMSVRAGADGTVFAVEPNPCAHGRLLENINLNRLGNVTALSCALSDARSGQRLFVPVDGTANRGVASFFSENVNYPKKEIPVEVKTLDGIVEDQGLNRLDFIKIDTEGNELRVLTGGRASIVRFQPFIVFEYDERSWRNAGADFDDAGEFFADFGYSLYVIGPASLVPLGSIPPQIVNILAIPSSRSPETDNTPRGGKA